GEAHDARTAAETAAVEAARLRGEAEESARAAAEAAAGAQAERESAEQRTVEALEDIAAAEQRHADELAAAVAARVAAENAAAESARLRGEAEDALAARELDRQAVESSVRHAHELVEGAYQDRLAAERRLEELSAQLAEVTARLRAAEAGLGPRGLERPAGAPGTQDAGGAGAHASSAVPASAPASTFASADPGEASVAVSGQRSNVLGSLLLVLAAVAAGVAVYSAFLADWSQPPAEAVSGDPLLAGSAALALVLLVVALVVRRPAAAVRIDSLGVVTVQHRDDVGRFDAYDSATRVEMVGEPGTRQWRVDLSGPGLEPMSVDRSMVDAEEFTRELRRWRPSL
ncbi:hypothetical protein, partial [Nocardioides bruguierae]|nr:hypothetical protein [Nocardioides bruguierae]